MQLSLLYVSNWCYCKGQKAKELFFLAAAYRASFSTEVVFKQQEILLFFDYQNKTLLKHIT